MLKEDITDVDEFNKTLAVIIMKYEEELVLKGRGSKRRRSVPW